MDYCDIESSREIGWSVGLAILLTAILIYHLIRRTSLGRPENVGLCLSLLGQFWLIHWVGLIVYLLPWFCTETTHLVDLGARESLYGLAGFTIGCLVLPRVLGRNEPREQNIPISKIPEHLPTTLLIYGCICYAGSSKVGLVASLTSVLSAGQQLIVAAVIIKLWAAFIREDNKVIHRWLLLSALFPVMTILTRGFIGYGIAALLPVVCFYGVYSARKRFGRLVVVAPLVMYVLLSVYVTYMRDRVEIRRTVWGDQSATDRVSRLYATVAEFEWFSPFEDDHLHTIDSRLNQSYLVGAAVNYIGITQEFARGETLADAAVSVIPRVIWPDKPAAGSGNMVSLYTGLTFDATTSVGVGQVLELYINYGSGLVFVGFVVIGVLLAYLDTRARRALEQGDVFIFLRVYLVGLSVAQIGGSFVEVVANAAASVVLVALLKAGLSLLSSHQEQPIRHAA